MSRDILDLIDNAIASTTSDDAMRWTPDQGFRPTLPGLAPLTMEPIRIQVWREPHTQHMWIAPLGTPEPVGPIEDNHVWVDVDALARPALELAAAASDTLAESLLSFLRHAGAAVGSAVEAMDRAGMIPEQPPVDPMARALWLRQHRNTGPAVQPRAPRRIDARRAR